MQRDSTAVARHLHLGHPLVVDTVGSSRVVGEFSQKQLNCWLPRKRKSGSDLNSFFLRAGSPVSHTLLGKCSTFPSSPAHAPGDRRPRGGPARSQGHEGEGCVSVMVVPSRHRGCHPASGQWRPRTSSVTPAHRARGRGSSGGVVEAAAEGTPQRVRVTEAAAEHSHARAAAAAAKRRRRDARRQRSVVVKLPPLESAPWKLESCTPTQPLTPPPLGGGRCAGRRAPPLQAAARRRRPGRGIPQRRRLVSHDAHRRRRRPGRSWLRAEHARRSTRRRRHAEHVPHGCCSPAPRRARVVLHTIAPHCITARRTVHPAARQHARGGHEARAVHRRRGLLPLQQPWARWRAQMQQPGT